MSEARCPVHAVPATATCGRCGRFACAACLGTGLETAWCAECRARPEAVLTPSAEAQRALWMALAAFHGVLVLLPFAMWLARSELRRIREGRSNAAGQSWALGAWWLSLAALLMWSVIAIAVLG